MIKSSTVIMELRRIADYNNGVLKPEDVIESARSAKSPIHKAFTWDDTDAAHEYRLWQARQLIRVSVEYIKQPDKKSVEVRAFVSLTPDRQQKGGGYRHTVTVMSNKDMRRQLLSDALAELQVFERKYQGLIELECVFKAAHKVKVA